MKIYPVILCLLFTAPVLGQDALSKAYFKADSLVKAGNTEAAISIYSQLTTKMTTADTIYNYVLWYYNNALASMEEQYRMREQYDSALMYAFKALPLIQQSANRFDVDFKEREFWMYKNVIVNYFGLNKLDSAKIYQDKLYTLRDLNMLPEVLEDYYNFEFFRWNDKNVWGYEWYPELGDPETQGSYSKIVYYIYSTNPDGSDKEQLYRMHVLKFHKLNEDSKIDYVMTYRFEGEKGEVSKTLYNYTYSNPLNYAQIRKDVRAILASIDSE
jgi:hypothetical protein